ncbi:hypothetical protein CC78DRAFT_549412 [Lojkania enalia]|uniref:Uncharacterized protein n=1 Tax=Lojkania enalia TaxID=147567 RepID=A0A9P4MY16_9PLEO|nr:hypothetical protein CC78DRAFT_549412 [Didymosphaeria enalia]
MLPTGGFYSSPLSATNSGELRFVCDGIAGEINVCGDRLDGYEASARTTESEAPAGLSGDHLLSNQQIAERYSASMSSGGTSATSNASGSETSSEVNTTKESTSTTTFEESPTGLDPLTNTTGPISAPVTPTPATTF